MSAEPTTQPSSPPAIDIAAELRALREAASAIARYARVGGNIGLRDTTTENELLREYEAAEQRITALAARQAAEIERLREPWRERYARLHNMAPMPTEHMQDYAKLIERLRVPFTEKPESERRQDYVDAGMAVLPLYNELQRMIATIEAPRTGGSQP